MNLEGELTALVHIRERSVGIALKKANFMIAALQNTIAIADKKAVIALELRAHLSLEEHLDEEFRVMRVTSYVVHIRPIASTAGLPRAVTIASVDPINVDTMRHAISAIEWAYRRGGCPRSQSIASFMKQQLEADGCVGVAVCGYRDQFSRKRGRIIAKGRLFKLLRKEMVAK